MARQNFAAGLEMTIGKVVRNYLRWFELNKYKKALAASPEYQDIWVDPVLLRKNRASKLRSSEEDQNVSNIHGREATAGGRQSIDFVDPLA